MDIVEFNGQKQMEAHDMVQMRHDIMNLQMVVQKLMIDLKKVERELEERKMLSGGK